MTTLPSTMLVDPILGVQHEAVSAGMSCDDGEMCNGVEVCGEGGVCLPGIALGGPDCYCGATECPMDPYPAAPPLPTDGSIPTFFETVEFLVDGPGAVQDGLTPGLLVPERAARLYGQVIDNHGRPFGGVRITIRTKSSVLPTHAKMVYST